MIEIPDKILDEWDKDTKFNEDELGKELSRVYTLMPKYMKMWKREYIRLKALKQERDRLLPLKYKFYNEGPSPETKDKGWVYPVSGKILHDHQKLWVAADLDIQRLDAQIVITETKVKALEYILEEVKYRTNTFRAKIDYEIWKSGG